MNTTLQTLHTNTTLISCRPRLVTQEVDFTFDGSGRILASGNFSNTSDDVAQYFIGDPEKLLMQSNNFMFPPVLGFNPPWHRDSFPSDWNSYIMSMTDPASRFLDPDVPPPNFNEAAELLSRTYTRMFAIWLGLRHQDLLQPSNDTTSAIQGCRYEEQTRIIVSKRMVVLAEAILASFVLTAVAIYARRPGCFLARLPTTISSCIAIFAASRLIEDVRSAGEVSNMEQVACFGDADLRLGYGTFLGTDGKLHRGIERKPFVANLG